MDNKNKNSKDKHKERKDKKKTLEKQSNGAIGAKNL